MDEVELHLLPHCPHKIQAPHKEPEFHPVEHYLQLSDSTELVASLPREIGAEETQNVVTLLVQTHHALQILSIFQSLRQHVLQPDTIFCVYGGHDTDMESFYTAAAMSASTSFQ